MRSLYLIIFIALMSANGLAAPGTSKPNAGTNSVNGLVSIVSEYSVTETVNRLKTELASRGMRVFTVIDHGKNAKSVEKELRSTQLVIFGNPKIGSQFMANKQTIAIDLPQKYLVWQDANGDVNISYNDPQYLKTRHNVDGVDELFNKVSNVLKKIATSAATKPTTVKPNAM